MYDTVNGKFLCDFWLFESHGTPCSPIFCAIKHEHVNSIPSSLICSRWTKDAKSAYITTILVKEVDTKKMTTI